jgi:tetratricopeptide (TPR) repeat protein
MNDKERQIEQDFHKKSAIESFNLVWSLLDNESRTQEDDDRMVHAAHASRFHWGEIGTLLEFERGEWQISRVYSVLNKPQSAIDHAQRCLELCKANHIGDFDIAFAYEALARANAIAGRSEDSEKYLQLAREAGENIEDKENKEYFFSELETVPGYPK